MSDQPPQPAFRVEVRPDRRAPWATTALSADTPSAALALAVAALYGPHHAADARVVVPAGRPIPPAVRGTVPLPSADGKAFHAPYLVRFARA